MMGVHTAQKELFSYQVDLDRRVRADHPLRAIRRTMDFGFVRQEVARCYGYNGNVSADPEVVMKLMFLLFFDNVKSERELLRMLPERLDYLWFLGFGLDDDVPDHSVLSKARTRWGHTVFEALFVRVVQQCVEAGLVDGAKLHLDGSLINAHASRDSVVKSSPELISALKRAYQVEERKLEGNLADPHYQPVNATLLSTTDPDAPCVRQSKQGATGDSRPRYKQHRAVDDRCGVITAVVTTPGDVPEPTQTETLLDQHHVNTGHSVATVVGDQQYGTTDNHRRMQERGVRTHLKSAPGRPPEEGRFGPTDFVYDDATDRYHCPAGQWLYPRGYNPRRQHTEYKTRKHVCTDCPLRARCTEAKDGRIVQRYREHELVVRAREQAHSREARRDYGRRRHLMEGSFAQSANCHGFKRARWRRLWRQQIQDWLIAACQNVKLLIRALRPAPLAACGRQIDSGAPVTAHPTTTVRLRATFLAPHQSSQHHCGRRKSALRIEPVFRH
jgi:transposase